VETTGQKDVNNRMDQENQAYHRPAKEAVIWGVLLGTAGKPMKGLGDRFLKKIFI
jgi:hypothetical protein